MKCAASSAKFPGLLEGHRQSRIRQRCVEISTRAALREMMPPGLITIITPILVGLVPDGRLKR
jgi:K(+)-stimulated pyrophosphate-energized sodium pump